MTWFYVDDHEHDAAWVRRAGLEAYGLDRAAGSWSADNLTDGWVPAAVAVRWTGSVDRLEDLAGRLVGAGRWTPEEVDDEKGWRIDWTQQPTREDVESKRAKRAAAGRAGGRASGVSRRTNTTPTTSEASAEAIASPIVERNRTPSRPVPSRDSCRDFVCRLTEVTRANDETDDDLIAKWTALAGRGVDLNVEAAAFLEINGEDLAAVRFPRRAWEAWLRKARTRSPTSVPSAQGEAPPCPVHPGEPAGRCQPCLDVAVPAPPRPPRPRKKP